MSLFLATITYSRTECYQQKTFKVPASSTGLSPYVTFDVKRTKAVSEEEPKCLDRQSQPLDFAAHQSMRHRRSPRTQGCCIQRNDGYGSWSCENTFVAPDCGFNVPGSARGPGLYQFWRFRRLNQVLSVSGRSWRVGRLLERRSTARTYAPMVVISGLTPMMFITRVKL